MGSTKLAMVSIFVSMVAITLLSALTGVIVYIANDSLPGDAWFPLKTKLEDVRVGLADTPETKARLYLQFAGRRSSELKSLLDQGRHSDVNLASSEFAKNIRQASTMAASLSNADPVQGTALNSEILVVLQDYSIILRQNIANIPGAVQPTIEKMEATSPSHDGTPGDDDNGTDDVSTNENSTVEGVPTVPPALESMPTLSPTMTPMVIVLPTGTPVSAPANVQSGLTMEGDDATCRGSVGAVTVENLRVPQGASCILDGTRVQGNIKVENSASLTAQRVTVIGNIQAEGASLVEVLAGSAVGGSIQLKQGGSIRVEYVSVNGDIQYESNHGSLSATGNQVGGNIQVFQNRGGVTISSNTVNGNLQCKENDPAPVGGNNLVQGNKEDQCAGL